ncbi:MAG: preprotein translocase subunit YajC [bacterium]
MIDVAWAQGAAGGSGLSPGLLNLPMMAVLFAIFYFMLIRPQQQKQKEHKLLLANLKKNDEVITTGGMYGRVMSLTDEIVTVEIAPNVRVRVSRAQIANVTTAKPSSGTATNDKEKDKSQ